LLLPSLLPEPAYNPYSTAFLQILQATFCKGAPGLDGDEHHLLDRLGLGILEITVLRNGKPCHDTSIFPYKHLFRITDQIAFNDNLPMIQDYLLQVFVVKTLIFLEFYQFFIIF